METRDSKYDELIGKIREIQPVLPDPDGLVAEWERRVVCLAVESERRRRILRWLRPMLGGVAILLLGFGLWEVWLPFEQGKFGGEGKLSACRSEMGWLSVLPEGVPDDIRTARCRVDQVVYVLQRKAEIREENRRTYVRFLACCNENK